MTEATQIAEGPVISTPEASEQGMVAPGQENLLEEFIQEQEQQAEPDKLLGKFNSTEDLAKAYQELERKLGQESSPNRQEQSPADTNQANDYTVESASQLYGKEAVESLAEKGIELHQLMQQADSGEDVSQHYDDLAEVFNVPRQVVENYVKKAQGGLGEAPSSPQLTEADVASIKEQFGGDQGFADLTNWAKSNLSEDMLANYNATVDSGNKEAIEWALRAISAQRQAPDAVVEPKLIGGGQSSAPRRFESKQQVLDAMNKRNERGQRLYDVDEAYRSKVVGLIAQSDVF